MRCMFCPICNDDRRLLAAHIRNAHGDKCHAHRLAHAVEHGQTVNRALVELPVVEVDIDAIHARQQPAATH